MDSMTVINIGDGFDDGMDGGVYCSKINVEIIIVTISKEEKKGKNN